MDYGPVHDQEIIELNFRFLKVKKLFTLLRQLKL